MHCAAKKLVEQPCEAAQRGQKTDVTNMAESLADWIVQAAPPEEHRKLLASPFTISSIL